jgi:hypothetical protein
MTSLLTLPQLKYLKVVARTKSHSMSNSVSFKNSAVDTARQETAYQTQHGEKGAVFMLGNEVKHKK